MFCVTTAAANLTYYRDDKYPGYIMITDDTITTGDPPTNVISNEF